MLFYGEYLLVPGERGPTAATLDRFGFAVRQRPTLSIVKILESTVGNQGGEIPKMCNDTTPHPDSEVKSVAECCRFRCCGFRTGTDTPTARNYTQFCTGSCKFVRDFFKENCYLDKIF